MLKHYIQFMVRSNSLTTIYVEQEVAERKLELAKVPENAYAYSFFDRAEAVVEGEKLVGVKRNESSLTYFGKVYTLDEVKAYFEKEFPENTGVSDNMVKYGVTRVVRTCCDDWIPLKEGDTVI